MKNYILLLLIATFGMQAQTYQNPTYGTVKLKTNTESTIAAKVNVQESDGSVNWQFIKDFQNNKPYFSTGLIKNGLLTINADNTKFDLSAGIGVYSDFSDPENVTSKVFNFPAFSAVVSPYIATSNITYVAINYNGGSPVLVMQASQFSNAQIRDLVVVGAVVHSNFTTINVINNISSPSNDVGNSVADLFNFLGARNQEGNVYSANGANLQLNKSAGVVLKYGANFHVNSKNPHNVSLPEQLSLTFRYRLQGGFEGTDRINVDVDNYDLNNVLTAVPNNKYTIQTIFIPQTGQTRIQYGQAIYNTLGEAIAAINTRKFNVETNLATQFVKVAYLVLKKGTTSLQSVTDADIIQASKFDATASGGVAITYQSIIDALNYEPENVVNKVTDIAVGANNTTYPTSLAVKTYADNLTNGTLNYIPKYIAGSKIGNSSVYEGDYGLRIGSQKTALGYGIGISKLITTLNRHIFDDYSVLNSTVGGFGFGVFDASTEMTGTISNDHFNGFQSRLTYSSSVPLLGEGIDNSMTSFLSRNNVTGSLNKAIGVRLDNIQGEGTVQEQYGLYVEPMTRGTSLNWDIYSPGDNNHFGSLSVNTLDKTNAFNLQGKTNSYIISGHYGGLLLNGKRYSAMSIGKSSDEGENGILSYYIDEENTTHSGVYLLNWGDSEINNSIFLKRGGNVGLGTLSPSEKLHVIGKGLFTNTITASPATVDTELATLGQAKAVARPYGVYTALLSQSGTNAPVATVLENTTGLTITYSRTSEGFYVVTFSSIVDTNKQFFTLSNEYSGTIITTQHQTSTSMRILVQDSITGNYKDASLNRNSFEIRVYP